MARYISMVFVIVATIVRHLHAKELRHLCRSLGPNVPTQVIDLFVLFCRLGVGGAGTRQ